MTFPFESDWTLFLDRDGVINVRKINSYLARWDDFHFLDDADQAIVKLSSIFSKIFVVTNQQGVAKGITSTFEIDHLHHRLQHHIHHKGGKIDRIYYCPDHQIYNPPCRKPNTGMAVQAKRDFPSIDFSKSVMVGDFATDIQMGHSLGMKTVFINNKSSEWNSLAPDPDYTFGSLMAFTEELIPN